MAFRCKLFRVKSLILILKYKTSPPATVVPMSVVHMKAEKYWLHSFYRQFSIFIIIIFTYSYIIFCELSLKDMGDQKPKTLVRIERNGSYF